MRRLVAWLRSKGWETTDIGDGASKAEAIASGDALAMAHVFISVPPLDGVRLAGQLVDDLAEIGVELDPENGANVEFTYLPAHGTGVLCLFCVSDADLPEDL